MANLLRITPNVLEIDRADFLENYFDYRSGQHLTILGPTDAGKSHLNFQLLGKAATPELPAFVLAPKPRDSTVDKWRKTLGFRLIRSFPPLWSPFKNNHPPGWVINPKPTFDAEFDDWILGQEFGKAFAHGYQKGNRIIDSDEALSLMDVGLWRWMRTIHTRGRSMGCGLWLNNQGPTDIGRYAYRQAAHLFVANDPDEEARKRYDQIGGVDRHVVEDVTKALDRFWFLYIRREGRRMCVIGP